MGERLAIRLKDIADELGVSLVTVSRVLRNQSDVGEATRARILQRMKELNYRPNMLARGLASGKSYTVGLIVPDLVHTFFADFAKGLGAGLRRRSYQLILASAEEEPDHVLSGFKPEEKPLIDAAIERARDGVELFLEKGADAAMREMNKD